MTVGSNLLRAALPLAALLVGLTGGCTGGGGDPTSDPLTLAVVTPDCTVDPILKPTTYELVGTVEGYAASARFEVSSASSTFDVPATIADGVARGTHTFDTQGSYDITLVVDTGQTTQRSTAMTCAVANAAPTITSLTPQNNAEYTEEDVITFSAKVADTDDDAAALTVVWSSAKDGELGSAVAGADGVATVDVTGLTVFNHLITARVSDPWGAADEDDVSVRISECEDKDGDGVSECSDCNDRDATIYPGAAEVCDGLDNDCNGEVDELGDADGDSYAQCVPGCSPGASCVLDCDDSNGSIHPGAPEVCDATDNNCDGRTDEGYDNDQDGYSSCTAEVDCDDANPNAHPGLTETCDTADNDCDGLTDEGLATVYYRDADNDGWGDPDNSLSLCVGGVPGGFTTQSGDCDDSKNTVHPEAAEACDGLDNNCDGSIDEGQPQSTFYADLDGDGYGDPQTTVMACVKPAGAQDNSLDCDDGDASVSPDGIEACDGADQDCDSSIDEGTLTAFYPDTDADTYGEEVDVVQACAAPQGYVARGGDCGPGDSLTYPGASERCDEEDNDCDGTTDEGAAETFYFDGDGDGYGVNSNTQVTCTPDAGYVAMGGDCKDGAPAIHPGATETCDGRDEDCDAKTDEGVKNTYYEDADGDGYGDTSKTALDCTVPQGYSPAKGDCDDTTADSFPGATELCDGKDNDCNGELDNGLTLKPFYTDADGDTYGDDAHVVQACAAPPGTAIRGGDCRDSNAAIHPGAAEECNSKDDDCDSGVDEGVKTTFYKDVDRDGYGTTEERLACFQCDGCATNDDDCDDTDPLTYPGAPERFDGEDNDCDGALEHDVPIEAAASSFGGVGAGSYTGAVVSRVGDLDGDQIDDLVFSAPRFSSRRGSVYVFYGRSGGWGAAAVTSADVTLTNSETDMEAGWSLTGGDYDNDGVADLAVGIPAFDNISGTLAEAGRVYIYYGGGRLASGDLTDLGDAFVQGYFPSVHMGWAVSSGDITCDGIDDLLIAAPWSWTAQYPNPGGGAAFIVPGKNSPYGGAGGIGGTELIQIYGDSFDLLGQDIAWVGDVGGTSCGDFIVSADGESGMGPQKIEDMGRVYLIEGGASDTLKPGQTLEAINKDIATWDGSHADDRMGAYLAGVGDVNGDTEPDFLVGRDRSSAGEPMALLFEGGSALPIGGLGENQATVAIISNAGLRCPCTVAGVGDVNSDGLSDFAVAVPGASSGGRIFLFFGREAAWPKTITAEVYADVVIDAEQPGDDAGISITGLGDVNDDGHDDFAIGARSADGVDDGAGKVYVFFGY